MKNTKTINISYVILFFCLVIAAITLVINHQGIGWDPALNIKMTDNGYKHIPFNHYSHPKPANLNEDETEFVTWWSPGQFAAPLVIEKCLGVKLNIALKLLTIICLLIAGLGIYKLFDKLLHNKSLVVTEAAPTKTSVIIFLLFTIAQPFFWGDLFVYDGGGILMLAYCPWFIYWVIKADRINFLQLLLLLVLSFFGFFLKSAFTGVMAGALFYLFLSNSILPGKPIKDQNFRKLILNAIYLSIVFAIYILTIKIAFLNHNRNISDSSLGLRLQPRVLFFPVVAPILSLFTLDGLNITLYWIIGSAFVVPVYYLMLRSNYLNLLYKHVLISFIGIGILFYGLLYFINVDVSYELRHYIIMSIILTPAFFIIFKEFRWGSYVVYSLMALYTAVNIYYYVNDLLISAKYTGATGYYTGLSTGYPADLIKKIHSLDNLNDKGRDIFYFTDSSPDIALEIRNNRVLLEDNYLNFHFNNDARFKHTLYFGRNYGQLYVIYPQKKFKKDSAIYLTRFEKYKRFEKIYEDKGYAIFKAIAL